MPFQGTMRGRVECLVADQHRDTVARDRGKRLERRYRRVRSRSVRLRALDVERRRETDALPGRHEAQRFVLGGRDRAHGLELAQARRPG